MISLIKLEEEVKRRLIGVDESRKHHLEDNEREKFSILLRRYEISMDKEESVSLGWFIVIYIHGHYRGKKLCLEL